MTIWYRSIAARIGRAVLGAAMAAVLAVIGAAFARADEVAVRVWPNPDFGRIVFDWPAPVGHRAEIQGNRLVLRFDRPVQTNLDRARQGLQRYVSAIQSSDGDRTLVFDLAQPSQVRSQANGNAVIVDIVPAPQAQASAQPAQPAPGTAPSVAGGSLPVRIGRHAGFTRLVFDWRQAVEYTVDQQGGEATIRFNRPARIDTGALAGDLPPEMRPVRVQSDERTSAVTVSIPPGARLRNFRSGTGVVLDVLQGSDTAQAQPQSQPQAQTQPPARPATPPQAPAQPQAQASPPPATAAQAQRPTLPGAVPRPGQPAPPANGRAAPAAPAPAAGQAAPPPPAAASATEATVPASPGQPAGRPLFASRPTMELPEGAPLPIDVASNADTVSIRFGWREQTAAAVFRRGSNLWIAFDRPVRLALDNLGTADRRILGEVEQVPVANGTVLRASVLPGINPRIWRDGEAWVVDLRPQEIRPEVALTIEVQPVSPQGPRIFIPAESIGEPIRVADPEIGDEIVIVPLYMLARGIDGERQYAQFTVLASEQGVAVKPNADDIEVRVFGDGIAVTSDRGLFISRAVQPAARPGEGVGGSGLAARATVNGKPAGQIFDLAEWRRGDSRDFLRAKQDLQFRVSEATALSRSPPRLDLARFYFANGLAPEALGLLATIELEDPELAAKPETKALRGAAKFAMRRYEEAREDLLDPALNGIKEVSLWRGASEAALGRWNEASEHFARAGEVPDSYPRNYKTDIALLGAEAAIRVANPRGAAGYLDVVANSDPSPADRARASFFRARVLIAAGDIEAGIDILRNLARGADRWSRVRSELAIIDVDLDRKRLSPVEAIERIEALRFTWRGDDIEFDTLYRLGQIYMQQGEFRQGLNAIRQAVTYYPNNQLSRNAARELTDAFARLYIDGAADRMTPLGALALYEDFRELTPVGERGDEIIKRLADRLVAVDLLDRAANLLDRQIKFRLQGVERARVGARLAVIRLIDRKPEAALNAIDASEVSGGPANLRLERGQLRARALFELERIDEAVKTLEADNTREGDLLRAEILWRSQRWAQAARVFERLVGPDDPGTGPIEDSRSRLVLNLAASLSLSSDIPRLTQLRQRYTAAMDKGPHRDAFRLITQRVGGEVSDFTTLVARFRELDQIQSFMAKYREKLSTTQLSAIN